jgi:thiol:disulfide interchange protein DsbA
MRYVDQIHYEVLPPDKWPDQAKVGQVLEFFSYGCPHCRSIEASVKAWQARSDADLVKVPVAWNKPFRTLAQLHYALAAEQLADQHGSALFSYLHDQKQRIVQRAHVESFVGTLGVDTSAVMKAFDAKQRDDDLRAADALARQVGIAGVPTFIVNGRYRVSLQMLGSPEELFRVIDFLLMYGPLNKR